MRFHALATAFFLIAALATTIVVTAPPAGAYSASKYVTKVLDGDTFEVAKSGTSGAVDTVRITGINTNETGTCHAQEATDRLKQMIEGEWVTLSADSSSSTAIDGRLLRFVDWSGVDVG